MRICVLSDTHGEIDNVKRLADKISKMNVDMIIHLGDDYIDAEALRGIARELMRVPGVYEQIYARPDVIRRAKVEIAGLRFLLSHTDSRHKNDPPGEVDPQDLLSRGEIDVLLHGHTHVPRIELAGRKLILNPGHLKREDKKGFPPTYMIIDVDDHVHVRLVELMTDRVIAELRVSKSFIR